MAYCANCGKQMDDNALFCKECGAQKVRSYKRTQFVPQQQYQPPMMPQQLYAPPKTRSVAGTVIIVLVSVVVGLFVLGSIGNALNGYEPRATTTETAMPENVYKSKCVVVEYNDLCRYPDKYVGDYIIITGEVSQYLSGGIVSQEGFSLYEDYDISMDTWLKKRWFVAYQMPETGRILEDDIVTFYGTFRGLETVTTVLGADQQVPVVDAVYHEIG